MGPAAHAVLLGQRALSWAVYQNRPRAENNTDSWAPAQVYRGGMLKAAQPGSGLGSSQVLSRPRCPAGSACEADALRQGEPGRCDAASRFRARAGREERGRAGRGVTRKSTGRSAPRAWGGRLGPARGAAAVLRALLALPTDIMLQFLLGFTLGNVVGMYLAQNYDIPNLAKKLEEIKKDLDAKKKPPSA
ncbi:short transmembrane mitochondrial protein 1 isoform X1 [Macaca nemestrina]|nr:PREDICTED: uncharacterized protein C7orf73 homolog [Macaca fascicularis]